MLSVTDAQLYGWIAAFFLPLSRILGMIAFAPLFRTAGLPMHVRLLTGIAIAVAAVPTLPPAPVIDPGSLVGLAAMAQEAGIGVAIAFAVRFAFAAVDVAGEMIGLQMSLSFASFYDPQNAGQTAVVAEFLGIVSTLLWLSLNGHLMLVSTVTESFHWLPVGQFIGAAGWSGMARAASLVFAAGVLLALPMIAALLITNIALGVLNRAAPALNLFAVGFPVTLVVGLSMLALTMSYLAPGIERLFDQGLELARTVLLAR